MNKHIKKYLDSFRVKKEFWFGFGIDAATLLIVTALAFMFNLILISRTNAVTGGRTPEGLKAAMIAGTVEANQLLLSNVKMFVFVLILGGIFVLVASLFIVAWSRSRVWNNYLKQKFDWKKYLKWNPLILVVFLILFLYLLIYALTKLIINLIISTVNTTVYLVINNVVNLIFVLIFFILSMLIFYSFTKKYAVWESVGNAFSLIKKNFKSISIMFGFMFITLLVINYLLNLLFTKIVFHQILMFVLGFIISLMLVNWVRHYLVKVVERD